MLNGVVASMSYNVGQYDSVAYQVHTISRPTVVEQFVIGAPSTIWRVFNLDGTPQSSIPVRVADIPPGPEEKEAEVDASLPKGPKLGTLKMQQSNDNIIFSDVPTYTADVVDNGDIIFTLTNPLALWHRMFLTLNNAQINFWVRVCARININQSD